MTTNDTAPELYVCECCHMIAQTGDESGCRDYWSHGAETHPQETGSNLGTLIHDETEDTHVPFNGTEWECDSCRGTFKGGAEFYLYRTLESFATDPKVSPDFFDRHDFWDGYRAALIWSGVVWDERDNGDAILDHYGDDDELWARVDPSDRARAMRECLDFIRLLSREVTEREWSTYADAVRGRAGSVWAMAGHDFCLTRNGHGVGYWDRGAGAIGDKLTEFAESYGTQVLAGNLSGEMLSGSETLVSIVLGD